MIPVQAVCNSILKRAFDEHISVSPMKMQKILYFIYRDYLQRTHQKLFGDNFQTWKYGPVVTSVYDEFKSFGASAITRFAKDANGQSLIVREDVVPDIAASITSMWALCKGKTGVDLSKITHEQGSAWWNAWATNCGVLCDEDIMKDETRII